MTSRRAPPPTLQSRRQQLEVGGPLVGGPSKRASTATSSSIAARLDLSRHGSTRRTGCRPVAAAGLPPRRGLGDRQPEQPRRGLPLPGRACRRCGCWRSATGSRPSIPFPAAVDDAVTGVPLRPRACRRLGCRSRPRSRVGGDSAGGNLAAVTAHLAVRAGEPAPAFLLLFYPPCDAVNRRRPANCSGGFLLTEADIDWFSDHYLPPGVDRADPRASILLADDLSGMPPTYLVTAGFDPIRDEGEMFADRLAAAGVPVVLRRQPDLVHGFANMIGLSPALPGGGRRGCGGAASPG